MSGYVARQWKAGDVAMVTALNRSTPYRAYFDAEHGGRVWREYAEPNSCLISPETVRPLVVIDPEDAEQVERLHDLVMHTNECVAGSLVRGALTYGHTAAALREFARPSRPEPPAFPALVADGDNEYWALHAEGMWTCVHSRPGVDMPRTWDTLCDDYGPIRVIFHGPADQDES